MTFLARLFRPKAPARADLVPLWNRIVAIGREPGWYAKGGVADSIDGRFDMISAVLALTLARMGKSPETAAQAGPLTELFVTDMDGQLRQNGIGDLVVGKHMGKLMAALGGRIAAYSEGLGAGDPATLVEAVNRNITFGPAPQPDAVAAELRQLAATLATTDDASLLAGDISR